MNSNQAVCPVCGECFEVSEVAPEDYGAELDYDCEVCCRPLILEVDADGAISTRAV